MSVSQMLKSDSVLLLTGTPLQNNVEELWSLLNVIQVRFMCHLALDCTTQMLCFVRCSRHNSPLCKAS